MKIDAWELKIVFMTIKGLTAKIVENKGKMAKVEIAGQFLEVPREYLPKSCGLGETFKAYFQVETEAVVSERQLAKNILEEILNGN